MQTMPAQQQDNSGEQDAEPVESAGETLTDVTESLQEVGLSLTDWITNIGQEELLVIGVAVGAFVVLRLLRSLVAGLLKGGDKVPDLAWRKIIGRVLNSTHSLFILIACLVAASPFLDLPDPASGALTVIFRVALIIQAALWIRKFALAFVQRRAGVGKEGDPTTLANAISVVTVIINVVVVAFTFLLLLQNAGIQITPLLAGLGVGGLAIGLAAQGIFSDLFAALSIIFDKPFEKGDFIDFGGAEGTVEKIGLRTTHIRSLTAELLIVTNAKLLDTMIRNYRQMSERRIFFNVGVTYQTPPDKAEKIPEMLKEAIESQEDVRFDRAHFIDFGDSALIYQAVYYVLSPDFVKYRNTHQAITFKLFRKFADEGLDFAFPTRTIHFSAPDGSGVDPREFGASAANSGSMPVTDGGKSGGGEG